MSKGILNKDYLQFITVVLSLSRLDCLIMEISALQTGQMSNWTTGLLDNNSPGIQYHLCCYLGSILSLLSTKLLREKTRDNQGGKKLKTD